MKDKPGKSGARARAKKLKVHVTYLEMTRPPLRSIPVPTKPVIALMRGKDIPVRFYRYLYELVGKPHHWNERRNLADKKLDALINREKTRIDILYVEGCPAGFFELAADNMPGSVEILHFGIGEDHQGLGLGKWFLSAAISAAWSYGPEKITVNTNTLDHPAALPLYQRLGFSPVAVSDEVITAWD